ncbi:LysR family transcriptional regulator [Aestuariibius sp. 2305UL40-4]|uniref:LysR family transcriptional regulator n=1 Tax=Aestuariibius violaceus TaxID=3234132 RepID=UPI00345E307D
MPLNGIASLDDLRLFWMIHEAGSISAAARRFGTSKARLSRSLARLEDEVGMPLFDRMSTGLKITQTGELLLPAAEEATRAGSRAEDLLRRAQATPQGHLRIAASALSAQQILGPVLAQMSVEFPEVTPMVQISALGPDPLAEDLDLVLRLGRPEEPYLIARRILGSHFRLYASATDARITDLADPEAVASLGRIVIDVPGAPRDWILTGPDDAPLVLDGPPICLVEDPTVALGILRAGRGVAFLPAIFGEPRVAAGDFRRALPDHEGPPIEVYASFPPKRASVPAVRAFIDLLVRMTGTV